MGNGIEECYGRILESIKQMPVVDCHEHLAVPSAYVTPPKEPLSFLLRGYFFTDLRSAGMSPSELLFLQDDDVPTEEKWPVFKTYWLRTEHTAYAREIKGTMRYYGEDEINLESLQRLRKKTGILNEERYLKFLDSSNIKALIVNIFCQPEELKRFIQGKTKLPQCYKLVIPLSTLHGIGEAFTPYFGKGPWSFQGIQNIAGIIDETVTSLDEFLGTVQKIMRRLKELGAVGMKEQSAYTRSLDFALTTRNEAEELFNRCLADPNNKLGWPESKPLDDFLFHEFMRFAREMKLPVQIHTGYLGGVRNRVDKANAALFTKVLELHQDVAFDLFHGNWPYMGDLLFLAKNYPNVYFNMCWLHIGDPLYSRELLERAVVTVPHKKIFGFGGDYGGGPQWEGPELIPAHLALAQENIAWALSNIVHKRWLSENQAIEIGADWLFNNPNEFYRLGLKPYIP